MTSIDDIERHLLQMPDANVIEGPHREQLRQQLLAQPLVVQQDRKAKTLLRPARLHPAKIAAGILVAAMLVGAGWAAEKVYSKLTFAKVHVTLDRQPREEWKLSNGRTLGGSGESGTVVNANDPEAIQAAQRHNVEMKELIAQKKYKFLRSFEDESTGGTEFVYQFASADGTFQAMNFSMRLENVSSWDDYQQKKKEQTRLYREQVNKAIAAGKYRLVDQDVYLVHICMDRATKQKLRVQRVQVPKNDDVAIYRPYNSAEEDKAITIPRSSWQEHLQAIRDEKLDLLDVDLTPHYKYEMTFEDGSKRFFHYGGGLPLDASKTKSTQKMQ